MKPAPMRRPRKGGYAPRASLSDPCQRVQIPCTSATRARLEALEAQRAAHGGTLSPTLPRLDSLHPDELAYMAAIRRLSFQGERPEPGSVGPEPWYLTPSDVQEYARQRLTLHRAERARLAALMESGQYARAPAQVVADAIEAGLPLTGSVERGAGSPAPLNDYARASIPLPTLQRAGHSSGARRVPDLLRDLSALLSPYGIEPHEIEEVRASVQALDVLPPVGGQVLSVLSAALSAGLQSVEASDRAVLASGGLAPRLPPADVWRCQTWERLRLQGRDVPPIPA